MIVGVPAETYPGERRVALSPMVVANLAKVGLEVLIQQEAGVQAGFPDSTYEEHGAKVVSDRGELFSSADVLVQVHGVGDNPEAGLADMDLIRSEQVMLGLFNPLGAPEAARDLAGKGGTVFALELLPRISRAQPMDVLTSMATLSGYRAVLLAAEALPKMYMMMMTAAGTITPARVFVVGAGVAGLQAIATSRRLGAVVQAYDIRPSVKEQVESVGAKFVEMELETETAEESGGYARSMGEEFYYHQRRMMTEVVAESDVVITTAAVPGRRAPILITEEMVQGMMPGSVIVDLAADMGGNCDLTRPGETLTVQGVTILGPVNVPSSIPYHASQMYARNLTSFLLNFTKDGEIHLNLEDQIVRDTMLTHKGEVVNPLVRGLLGLPVSTSQDDQRSSG